MVAYKMEHELFVSGHNGTSYMEVAMITSISCMSCFARDLYLLSAVSKIMRPRILMDFFLLVLPNILSVTLLSSYTELFLLVILTISLSYCFHLMLSKGSLPWEFCNLNQITLDTRKKFITYFRSLINLCTSVAILAVDFPVFPRHLAKAEKYGFGGMDIGVGLYVMANAIVSSEARGKYNASPITYQMEKAVVSSLPLLILGLGRLLSVKSINYQEHVTEYGVHWNFFFTLAALKMCLPVIYCIVPAHKSAIVAITFVCLHQTLLSSGLASFIMHGWNSFDERKGLINANREGICSLPGYIALYMFGVQLGNVIFKKRSSLREWLMFAKQLTFIIVVSALVMVIFHAAVEPVSRRLANAAFVFWILSLGCMMILQCLMAEIIVTVLKSVIEKGRCHQGSKNLELRHQLNMSMSKDLVLRLRRTKFQNEVDMDNSASFNEVCLMDAISYNALFFFLLANLMTGIVNMSISTIHTTDLPAMIILIVYMFILCEIICSLRSRNISTKIW